MQQHVSSLEQGSLTTLLQCCGTAENGNDHLQMPSWSGVVLRGWRIYPVSSVVGRWQLRSVDSGTHVVLRTRTTIGWRDFDMLGSATWNSLPVELRASTLSIETFVQRLRNHLFGILSNSHHVFNHLLPDKTNHEHNLWDQRHNRSLCVKADKKNFLIRQPFKDSY